jgi:Mg-chelatase subunit ChlD
MRWWAFWRRVQYGTLFCVFWIFVGVFVYYANFYTPATCFDSFQNGDERGVDCDGSCVRICAFSVTPPKIVWADSFRIIDGQYNAVAYVENSNPGAATPELRYSFKLLDQGAVIAERKGTTILPPNSVYPIFEGRIMTKDGRIPTETIIEIEPAEMWLPATVGRNQFKVNDFDLSSIDSRPRLTAQVENVELTDADDIEVVATIFNSAGKPLTASQTLVDNFAARSVREVVFTWPNSIARTVRSCEVPSDIVLVLDRSGSMAADGGDPVEPLSSAKLAAGNFVDQVKKNARLGFVSYATTPSLPMEQSLTADTAAVKSAILGVTMGKDGVQYTNMGDAFKVALEELKSVRHREDARKVIIFMTDGDVTRPVNPETGEADREYAANYAKEMAAAAKSAEATIYTIGFGSFLAGGASEVARDTELIKSLATSPEHYFEAPTTAELAKVYSEIADGICEEGPTRVEIITKTATNFAPLR